MTCPNCKATIRPGVNEPTVTCGHCASVWELTPSGHIRRVKVTEKRGA